ncbi:MAG: diaminopimelate decarboxylase [Peptoniphilus sp.]|nr:diaminopimelate decarboxylase [Peptoniphilus sp.]MDD7362864.1 diaminopimelate decarboxylase [Bacillota bacterium]MDY6043944.1 diaminopimelate decarboxylase [Peptoniphilus sp.]
MLDLNFRNKNGVLHIGGVSVESLAYKYKTPLYVYDQKLLKKTAEAFKENFKSNQFNTEIVYATKAFSNLYVLGLLNTYGFSFDCVSYGEMSVCLKAGIRAENIHFHGNNKTYDELSFAVDHHVGLIIIDSSDEYSLLNEILTDKKKQVDVLLRINPDVKTDTHQFIQTSNADSKFGVNIRDDNTKKLIKNLIENENMNLLGFHAHIGSQVKDLSFFEEEAKVMIQFTKKIQEEFSYRFTSLNLGGGFGCKENFDDDDLDLERLLRNYISIIESLVDDYGLDLTDIGIEPGRSMVGMSGSTLYRVGSIKKTLQGHPIVFVDGGMSDNIRVSLYDAKYSAFIANKMDCDKKKKYRVGGKLCESGDFLIKEEELAIPERDDLLLIPFSGAYTYAMSSNYNKLVRPAVVFVEDGKDFLAVKRQDIEHLIENDLYYKQDV